jgi:hypothetical protein
MTIETTDQQAVTVAQGYAEAKTLLRDLFDDSRISGTMIRVVRDHLMQFHRLASVSSASAETFLAQLRRVNSERYEAWVTNPIMLCEHCGADASARSPVCKPPFDNQPHSFTRPHPYLTIRNDAGMMFDALELGGEVGELLNIVKKLEREERGWRGSRANPADFDDECADVLICLDKLARRRNVDLAAVTIAKFNATSDKVGLPHRLAASPEPVPATNQAGEVERLREALKPFAKWADWHDGMLVDDSSVAHGRGELGGAASYITVGDLRRARAALATQPATSQEGEEAPRVAAFHAIYGPNADLFEKPEGYAFASDVAAAVLAATPTPPTLSEDLRETVWRTRLIKLARQNLVLTQGCMECNAEDERRWADTIRWLEENA